VQVRALAWGDDGSTLAAADTDGTVRLWSARPRTEEAQDARRAAWDNYALGWHGRSARDAERQRQWFAAAFHLSKAIDAGPADGGLFLRRGLANAHAERWAEAADDFGRAIELDRLDTFETRYRHALLLRGKGDMPGYRKAVAYLTEHWGDTADPKVARRLLQALVLDGERAVERKPVERLTRAVLSGPGVVDTVAVDGVGTRLDTASTYAEALRLLTAVGAKDEKQARLTWLFLPLVCEKLGDDYQAAFWLGQAARQIKGDRWMLVEKIEGRLGVAVGEEVTWVDLLELDLLKKGIDALLAKAAR
jgi:tetratricopeptide (TPR) repeat protein